MDEPTIRHHHRQQLAYLLTEAAEIEHGLMCCYLYAAFSLKRGPTDGLAVDEAATVASWRRAILAVAIDEMLHLSLVSNLLNAIGAAPHLERPNFPVPPGYHPAGVVVSLAPFDTATLDHFVFLERPEGVELPDGRGFEPSIHYQRGSHRELLMPTAQDYFTVGHLYRGIREGLVTLTERLGEERLFVGDRALQVGSAVGQLDRLVEVVDLASGLRAIDTIVEQGEGAPGHSDGSHYARFVEVRDSYRSLLSERPGFAPAHPAARNPVMRAPAVRENRVHVTAPQAERAMDLANSAYNLMLQILAHGFASCDPLPIRSRLFSSAIECMSLMVPIAEEMPRLPASDAHPGVTAGMSFALSRSTARVPTSAAAFPVMAERARELGLGCEEAASLVPSLRPLASRWESLARSLDGLAIEARAFRARSAKDESAQHQSAQPKEPAMSDPTPASAPEPDVEEARGEKLILRFDGKRCIHSRQCVLGAPHVFLANVQGPWIRPDAGTVEELIGIAHSCPSGAITYERLDGGAPEPKPRVNVVRVRENGPLAISAEMVIEGHGERLRATLCRCGQSKKKPFCDGSHGAASFAASGEPATQESKPLEQRGGLLTIRPKVNGPLQVEGNVEICTGTGRTINRTQKAWLCRCGASANKPYCDGSHNRIGFVAE